MRYASLLIMVGATVALTACSGGDEAKAGGEKAGPSSDPSPVAATAAYASLTGDAVRGERLFVRCRSCHAVEAGMNRVGPSLNGVMGRPAAAIPKFRYSNAIKASGVTWSEEAVFAFLENPRKSMPGTYMSFAGLRDPQERADMIAYLKTLS